MALCLVTGGAGFIGSHLVEALLGNGHQVRVLDNFHTGSKGNLAAIENDIECINGDVADLEIVREVTRDVEYVFHQAAQTSVALGMIDPLATHQACATGTLHVLIAAREAQVRRVIYASSSGVYDNAGSMPTRETSVTYPLSPHAVAKLAGEEYCAAYHHIYGLETVRLRYFNVFGPRQPSKGPYAPVIPQILEAMLAGKHPLIHGDGLQTRDFTYVNDVVQANWLAMDAPRVAGKVYNIGSGRRTSLLEIVDIINDILGTHIRPFHDNPRPGDIRHSQADISLAQVELGFCPCTDLKLNLTQCLDYYAARRQQPAKPSPRRRSDAVAVR
jgi:UDP-glucose 4-epimerase